MNRRYSHPDVLRAAKSMSISQNLTLNVLDQATGSVVQSHTSHNTATNSLLMGIGYFLIGNIWADEPYTEGEVRVQPTRSKYNYSIQNMLSNYVPKYISLGTAGLMTQRQDESGLPILGEPLGREYDEIDPDAKKNLEDLKKAYLEAKEALGKYACLADCECCRICEHCTQLIKDLKDAYDKAKEAYENAYLEYCHKMDQYLCDEYIKHGPGYGADGYDFYQNNDRTFFGLGPAYTSYSVTSQYKVGDVVCYKGAVYRCLAATPDPCGPFDSNVWDCTHANENISEESCNLELISPSAPRVDISYRDIVPESESELPKTVDVVFSAMISTGALSQFRPKNQPYLFITEAGLWSKKDWNDSGENGLLAGYRIVPPNTDNHDMSVPENRGILKRSILKVGINQVVQVIWKIQLGIVE